MFDGGAAWDMARKLQAQLNAVTKYTSEALIAENVQGFTFAPKVGGRHSEGLCV